ncbi:ribosomal RNA processing protein 1 homolog B isoform X2 [Malaclemys terrapin pileata]|uniref:ribosomal RNA processing protein 1 homolog B isoform X2 n=1 Tax=Malaclemys terrapin pileata TaxID=2991368 RepID=UPI0023A86A78|nr:ribosomal RNA processing protein 1 homolog B isoform X2 [Malaclemys terrapin pileata]
MERVSRFQRAGGRDAFYPAEGGGAKGDGGAGTMAPAAAAAAAAVQPPEIQFAQRLAANEKRSRDRAVKKLRGYISLRTQSPAGGFSQEELLKIWKGLFYCMWMQDKPLLQEELASTISQLIHVVQNIEAQHLFIQTFWQTMNREWNGIDRLRLDKYYMLIRMVLRQSFEVLKRNGWDESLIEPFLHLLMKEVIHPESNAPNGIKFHFIDIYLEELAKAGAKELTADQNLKFIEPFCKIAAKSKDRHLMQAVARGIFEAIVDQSPFAIEDLMKELKTSCDGDVELSEGDEAENKEPLVTKDKRLPKKSALGIEVQEDLSENADENIGPVLQFNYKAVADRLFELASRKNTPAFNRKRLYKLVKKFQDLAEGIFPQDDFPEDVSTDEDDDTFSRGRRKKKVVKSVEKAKLEKEKEKDGKEASSTEEDDASGLQKKRKRRKKRDCQIADSSTADGRSEEGVPDAVGPKEPNQGRAPETSKRKRKNKSLDKEATETGIGVTGSEGDGDSCAQDARTDVMQTKRRQLKKKNTKLQKVHVKPVSQNGPANANALWDGSDCATVTTTKMVKKKQKMRTVLLNGLSEQAALQSEQESLQNSLTGDGDSESTLPPKVKLKKKPKLGSLDGLRVSNQKPPSLKKKRKIKEVINSVEVKGILEAACKKSKKSEVGGTLTPLKKTKAKTGNDFVKFEKTTLPKPVFFRKAKGSLSSTRASMQLNKLQCSSSKKVTFGLNKNMTAEFKKTDKSILVSPEGASRVAFNPEQKPPHGVLKSPGTPTAEPQMKKSFVTPAKKRPTAMDFF